ncbi:MAG TPA: transglycosylase SLT domain-containing protein [Myxococcota bacterium]|nr:transglycosylase SLT domain-containing protein [Myxococcota bacterium]
MSALRLVLALLLLAAPVSASASPLDVPLEIDYAFLRQLLLQQIYTSPGETAEVWRDEIGCNHLILSEPRIYGREGRLRILTASDARVGTPIAGACTLSIERKNQIELWLEPVLAPGSAIVHFRVVDSNVFEASGRKLGATGILWSWVKEYVHPRLASFQVDLEAPLSDLRSVLPLLLPSDDASRTQHILDSVALAAVRVSDTALVATLRFDVPPLATAAQPATEAPLTDVERVQLRAALERWDAFLTYVIKAAGSDAATKEARQELLDILLDARQELIAQFEATQPEAAPPPVPLARSEDPVRRLFVSTWTRLAPVLRKQSGKLPGEIALRYLGFLASGDALAALDRLGPEVGLEISQDGLRRFARLLSPSRSEDPLAYGTQIDTELRAIFGFGPPIEPPQANPAVEDREEGAPRGPKNDAPAEPPKDEVPGATTPDQSEERIQLPWSLVESTASKDSAELATRLNGWVPGPHDLEAYLRAMGDLLGDSAQRTLARGELAPRFDALFHWLVLATAWTESCWRQFVRIRGRLEPIRSAAGAVGIMQVNEHVWRGFYDLRGLRSDVGYNSRAGSEILLHYLTDYAIEQGEDTKTGHEDNLARATYAVYNGGPGHLRRYRQKTRKSLHEIDEAFWRHYQAVKAGHELDLADECYGG